MRGMFLIGLVFGSSSALARVDLTTPNNTTFGIDDTGRGQLLAPALVGGWPELCVRVCADCDGECAVGEVYNANGAASQPELNQRQRALAGVNLAGLRVDRRIYVPSAGQANANGFVRYLDSLTNDTGAAITVQVRFGQVRAAGGGIQEAAATLWRTHSDDAAAEPTDRWLLTDDNNPDGGAAALGLLAFGSGARFRPARIGADLFLPDRPGAIAWEYRDVLVPAFQTVSFLSVIVHEARRVDALDEVEHLLQAQTVDLLFGLDAPTRRAIANFDVDPDNASPLADAGGPYNATEGSQVGLSAVRSFDPEAGVMQYTWDLDNDGAFDDAQGANAFVTFGDDGQYPVRVRVQDPGGKFDVDTAQVAVRNVNPRIDGVVTDSPVSEGEAVSVDVRVTDPGADVLMFDFDWDGDGAYEEVGLLTALNEHRYADEGVYDASVRVRDDDGGVDEREFMVVVTNRAPVIQQFFAASPVLEGSQVAVNTVAFDPGGDPISYCYDLDDDGAYETCGDALVATSTVFTDNGLFTIRVRVRDNQGLEATREFQVSVLNARPELTAIENTGPVPEGSPVTIIATARDPGAADVLDYSFDLDNDGLFDDDVVNQAEPFVDHIFRQQGEHIVGVRVRDDDGAFAGGNTVVTVTNAPPVGVLVAPQFVVEGEEFVVEAQATDPGDDLLTYSWDFDGDGMFDVANSHLAVQRHTFAQQGDYEVRCVVSDGDGGEAELSAEVFVRNEIPRLAVDFVSPQPEGAEVVMRAVAQDQGGDVLLYSFDVDNDGEFEFEQQRAPIVRWRYPDNGTYTIRVVVDDGQDVVDTRRDIEISNVAPMVRLTSNSPVNEGQEMVFTAEVTDPGTADTFTLHWNVAGVERDVVVNGPGDLILRLPAADDDIFNAELTATDDDQGASAVGRSQMIVANLPPTFVPIGFVRPAIEEQPYNQVVPAVDPAGAEDPLTFGLIDPPAGVAIEPETGLITWIPTFDQFLASPITLTVRVSDGDGGSARSDIVVEVLPLDEDGDDVPDTFERNTCNADRSVCLNPDDASDAQADPDDDGRDNLTEWLEGTDPFIYEGASIPQLVAPANGVRVDTLTPTFLVSAVTSDRAPDEIFIVFQIFADAELQEQVILSDQQLQGGGAIQNRWTIPVGRLLEDNDYYWRAAAIAEGVQSPWSPVWRFRTNVENVAPSAPVLLSPEDGAVVDTLAPSLRNLPSVDSDGDGVVYKVRIYRRNGEPFTNGVGQVDDGFIAFDTAAVGLAENGTYLWDVVAEDEAGGLSEPSARWSFTVNTDNQGPSTPVIIAPTAGALVTDLNPLCVAGQVRDDDDTEVGYVFQVRVAGAADVFEESSPVIVAEGMNAEWSPTNALMEDTDHTLEVHALDAAGGVSASAQVTFFVSAIDHGPPKPTHLTPVDGGKVGSPNNACVTWSAVADPERAEVRYVVTYCNEEGACGESLPLPNTGFCLGDRVEAGKSYQWQVEAFDLGENGSGKTAAWTFSIESGGGGGASDEGCCSVVGRGGPPPWLTLFGLLLFLPRRRRT